MSKKKKLKSAQQYDFHPSTYQSKNNSDPFANITTISQEKKRVEIARNSRNKKAKIRAQKVKRRRLASQNDIQSLPHITINNIVVRRNIFKCAHNNHKLQDLQVIITMVNNDGQNEYIKTYMGYCNNCNIYFIFDSQYQELRKHGVVLLRATSEKDHLYHSQTTWDDFDLAQESILMQFGYNVNQNDGLSELDRHKILAVLIDKEILTKSEIISYLDFFISQREGQNKYNFAISKWEIDRDFVIKYKFGHYEKYGIKSVKHY